MELKEFVKGVISDITEAIVECISFWKWQRVSLT